MKFYERLAYSLFILLITWLPVPLGSNRAWAWSISEIWVALISLLILIAYKGHIPFRLLNHYKLLVYPMCLFQAWVTLQLVPFHFEILSFLSPNSAHIYQLAAAQYGYLSIDSRMTQITLIKGLSYTLLVINAIILVNSSKRLKWLALAIICSGTFQAFYASLMVLLEIPESAVFNYPEEGIATGSFVYKNHLANYLMMCLCIGLGYIVTELRLSPSGSWHHRLRRILEGILSEKMLVRLCLIIMVIALVMTRSRMGNTAFFFATAFGGILALLYYKQRPRALTILVASVLIIDTIIIGTLFGLEKVKQRLVETSLGFESRDQVVMWALDIVRDFPWTGTGLASFYTIFPMYSHGDIGFYDHAHNEYIQFMVEVGIPATIVLSALVLFAFWRSLQTIRDRNSRTMKGLALGCIMSITGMLVHMSVDFTVQPPANAITFLLVLFIAHACFILPVTGRLPIETVSVVKKSNIKGAING